MDGWYVCTVSTDLFTDEFTLRSCLNRKERGVKNELCIESVTQILTSAFSTSTSSVVQFWSMAREWSECYLVAQTEVESCLNEPCFEALIKEFNLRDSRSIYGSHNPLGAGNSFLSSYYLQMRRDILGTHKYRWAYSKYYSARGLFGTVF